MSTPEDTGAQPDQFSAISSTVVGGDLAGNLPDPTIAALQGTQLEVPSPNVGQVLIAEPVGELGILTWVAGTPSAVAFRKTTTKQVVNTVAETDLLNGEVVLPGSIIAAHPGWTGLRLTCKGTMRNNSGATQASPRFRVELGGTKLIDTQAIAAAWGSTNTDLSWKAVVEILNASYVSQWTDLLMNLSSSFIANLFTPVLNAAGVACGEFGTNSVDQALAIGGGASAVDVSLGRLLAFTVVLPVANANVNVTLQSATVEWL